MAFDYTKTVKRTDPASGTSFRTPQALVNGGVAQGVVMFDDDENHVGVDSNPMATKETVVGMVPFSPSPGSSGVIKATPGSLKGFVATLTTAAAAARYFQIFDSAAVPSDTTEPTISVEIRPGKTIALEWDAGGRSFSNGISWAVSSTEHAKTAVAEDVKLSGRAV